MTPRTPIFLTLVLALLGCERIDDSLDDRRQIIQERAAIERYAEAVAPTLEIQQRWVDAVRETSRLSDAGAIGASIRDRVIPALTAYRDAIAEMPTQTAELKDLHAEMVDTHSALLAGYGAFARELTAADYEPRRAALSMALDAFHARERSYRDGLREYYEARGFDLQPAPGVK